MFLTVRDQTHRSNKPTSNNDNHQEPHALYLRQKSLSNRIAYNIAPAKSSIKRLSSVGDAVRESICRVVGTAPAGAGRSTSSTSQPSPAVPSISPRLKVPLSSTLKRSHHSRSVEEKSGFGESFRRLRSANGNFSRSSLRSPLPVTRTQRRLPVGNKLPSQKFSSNSLKNNRYLSLARERALNLTKKATWIKKTSMIFMVFAAVLLHSFPLGTTMPLLEPVQGSLSDEQLERAILELYQQAQRYEAPADQQVTNVDQAGQLDELMEAPESQVEEEEEEGALTDEQRLEQFREPEANAEGSDQNEVRDQSSDSFWVQRRRLNRDRALEPASLLREQPMRRASPNLPGPEEEAFSSDTMFLDPGRELTDKNKPVETNWSEQKSAVLVAPSEVEEMSHSDTLANLPPASYNEDQMERDENNQEELRLLLPNLMKRSMSLLEPTTERSAPLDESAEQELPVERNGSPVNKYRLALLTTRLKSTLEDLLKLPRSSILGLFPLNNNDVLVQLQVGLLSRAQLVDMIRNRGFTKGYLGVSWPKEAKENPVPLLRAILRAWADTNSRNMIEVFDRFEDFFAQFPADSWPNRPGEGVPDAEELEQSLEAQPSSLLVDTSSSMNSNKEDSPYDDGALEFNKRFAYYPAGERPTFGRAHLPTPASLRAYKSFEELIEPVDRLLLLEYLRALEAREQAIAIPIPQAYASQRLSVVPLQLKAARPAGEQPGEQSTVWSREVFGSPHVVHLFAIVAVLAGTCLAVKFAMKSSDKQLLLRGQFARLGKQASESLKSFKSQSISGEVEGGSEGKDLEKANMENRAAAPEHESFPSSNKCKSLDMLSQRLVRLLKRGQQADSKHQKEFPESDGEEELIEGNELDEWDYSTHGNQEHSGSQYRSSRSYIKSLIEVLSNARSYVPSLVAQKTAQSQLSEAEKGVVDGTAVGTSTGKTGRASGELLLDEAGIVASQMDIQAAHLILTYMERHLEDKERLRREWLELNLPPAALPIQPVSGKQTRLASEFAAGSGNAAKMRQLMLQKLAKVALSEENKLKNRNTLVVPFDRNRVKLFGATVSPSPSSSSAAFSATTSTTKNSSGSANKGFKPLGQSDYINASYIYDDDLRRPTHIIAQGPTEQTVGQFWQMIWEQGVSIIVMLTRLNENGQSICNCYWPTSPAVLQVGGGGGSKAPACSEEDSRLEASSAASLSEQPASFSWNGRRGSVTSVLNGASVKQALNAQTADSGLPIVGNGDLVSNVLVFDIGETSELQPPQEEPEWSARLRKDRKAGNGNGKSPAGRWRLEVHLVSEHVSSNDYLVRNLCIINRTAGETRTITQFHYLAWPMDGVPANARSLLSFRRKVHKSYRDLKSPILVHCSDGAGRSGTYTLIDIILERIKNGAKEIDPRATLEHLRDQRVGLCSTQSQFEFVLVALAEEIQLILNALPK